LTIRLDGGTLNEGTGRVLCEWCPPSEDGSQYSVSKCSWGVHLQSHQHLEAARTRAQELESAREAEAQARADQNIPSITLIPASLPPPISRPSLTSTLASQWALAVYPEDVTMEDSDWDLAPSINYDELQ
jgi:hypothetical protein